MLQRVLEPEIGDGSEAAGEYQQMDHRRVNSAFVDDLAGGIVGSRVIDLGCGPGAIAIELAKRLGPDLEIMGIDLDVAMLEIARLEVEVAGLAGEISLQQADLKELTDFQAGMADTVISNSVAHHLRDPADLVQAAMHLCRDGGRIFIRDLYRPPTIDDVERLVEQHASEESTEAQQLLRQSLQAALTLDEIQQIAGGLGIPPSCIQMTSGRHWTLDWTCGS